MEVNLFKYGVRAKSPHKKTQGGRLKPAREAELAPTFFIRDLLHVWKISRLKVWRWIALVSYLDLTLVGAQLKSCEQTVVSKASIIGAVLLPGQIDHL